MPLFNKKKTKDIKILEKGPAGQNRNDRNFDNVKVTKKVYNNSSSIEADNYIEDDHNSVSDHILTDEILMRCIDSLSSCKETFLSQPTNALRKLFTMSEHTSSHPEYRTQMVSLCSGILVPVLIEYLRRCQKGSSELYLSLLILNNLSIPVENKKFISLECKGIQILSNLICEDPSSHLICIILVNLSFADSDLRRAIVDPKLQLVPALSYTLKIATLSNKYFQEFTEKIMARIGDENEDSSPSKYLSNFITEEDQQKSRSKWDTELPDTSYFESDSLAYPETVRWCLCALKSITFPLKHPSSVAEEVLNCGILPILIRFVTVSGRESATKSDSFEVPCNTGNHPYNWDANSSSDTALSILLNLCYTQSVRSSLKEVKTFQSLVRIAEYSETLLESKNSTEEEQLTTQCIKARMALSYLIGSEGHLGQPHTHIWSYLANADRDQILIVLGSEAPMLLELLGNSLHNRGKKGPGGYSSATFHLKQILLALRCLLTNSINIKTFYAVCGTRMNALFLKAIALHSFKESGTVDSEAAEYAIFSLYLMSNFGFNKPFLPNWYNHDLVAKILLFYSSKGSTSALAKHAAEQLLLRLSHIISESSSQDDLDLVGKDKISDYELSVEILEEVGKIIDVELEVGEKPMEEIFNRPVVRNPMVGEWPKDVVFPCALEAVQYLVVDAGKVGPLEEVDDIIIANNIAINAEGGRAPNYGFNWSWQDQPKNIYRTKFNALLKAFKDQKIFGKDEPLSIFGITSCSCSEVRT